MVSVDCPRLVGRESERTLLRAAVDGAIRGRGALVLIAGEAGAGKSRLLRETAAYAERHQMPVLFGRALEGASPAPYRPLAQALLSHLRQAGIPDVPELAPYRSALARLVPEWQVNADAGTETSLVVVAEAVLRLLRIVGRERGCLLGLEDLQWSDAETVEIVAYLADSLANEPVVCAVTVREEEAGDAVAGLRAMSDRWAAQTVRLTRLDGQAAGEMAAACLRADSVPEPLLEFLDSAAEGLPFLVEEVLATVLHSGELRREEGGWLFERAGPPVVPLRVSDMVRRRLRASGQMARLLRPAALLGRTFDWQLLPRITGMAAGTVTELLRQGVESQLIAVHGSDGLPGFRFRHALTRDAVLAGLLPPERAVLARRVLAAVESAYPGLPGGRCELAASLAEQAGDSMRAGELFLEAGRRALAQGALASADAALGRARRLVGDDRQAGVEVDDALCAVLALSGDNERLDEVGERLVTGLAGAGESAPRVGAVHMRLARAALAASNWRQADYHLGQVRALGLSGLEAELGVLAAALALGRGEVDQAVGLAAGALSEAQRASRHELACEAFEILGRCQRQHDLAAAEHSFSAALALAEANGLALWRIRALHELGTVDLLSGGPAGRLAQARRAALDSGALATATTVALQMSAWYLNRMALDQAMETARGFAGQAHRLRMPVVEALGKVFEGCARALRGQGREMETVLGDAMTLAGDHPEILGVAALQARAAFWLVREDRARALAELDTGMDLLRPTLVTAPMRGMWALLRTLADRDGDAAIAEVEQSGLIVYWLIDGWVGHARAVSLGRKGRRQEAEEAFARADATLSRCEWHRQHARRLVAESAIPGGWGDPAGWLGEALEFFTSTGYERIASACRSLLRRTGTPVPRRRRPATGAPPPFAGLGLTARELEVMELLAEALSTRDIASRLYLSPKTVERHIANVAAKVGVEGRAQLIAFAASRAGGAGR